MRAPPASMRGAKAENQVGSADVLLGGPGLLFPSPAHLPFSFKYPLGFKGHLEELSWVARNCRSKAESHPDARWVGSILGFFKPKGPAVSPDGSQCDLCNVCVRTRNRP